jgi:hypothetical protein
MRDHTISIHVTFKWNKVSSFWEQEFILDFLLEQKTHILTDHRSQIFSYTLPDFSTTTPDRVLVINPTWFLHHNTRPSPRYFYIFYRRYMRWYRGCLQKNRNDWMINWLINGEYWASSILAILMVNIEPAVF